MSLVHLVIWMHFFCDFVLQTDKMAKGKSKSNRQLSIHIAAYATPFLVLGWRYALVNGLSHWIVDWFTSRATSRLWARGQVHNFFVVIGLDQAIHMTTLIATLGFIR